MKRLHVGDIVVAKKVKWYDWVEALDLLIGEPIQITALSKDRDGNVKFKAKGWWFPASAVVDEDEEDCPEEEFKVGDRVLIKKVPWEHWVDEMDRYDGTVCTVRAIFKDSENTFTIEGDTWVFPRDCIVCVESDEIMVSEDDFLKVLRGDR